MGRHGETEATSKGMKIISAGYLRTVTQPADRKTGDVPEVCFIGRSNVGKSSLINRLVMQKVARTSSTPGATKAINLYEVSYDHGGTRRRCILSDFPGFGYSKVSKTTYRGWEALVDGYITGNRFIRRLVWVLDIRRDLDELDETVFTWVQDKGLSCTVVLTKSDKEGRGHNIMKKERVAAKLATSPVFIFSSKDGRGRQELLTHLLAGFDASQPLNRSTKH